MDSVNSTTFIKKPPCMTDTQEKFLYTRELLSGRIFLGCYRERRYVEVLKEYRDVVVINFEETDLHRDLDKLKKKWAGVTDVKWVGITGPDEINFPKEYCFWVKLTGFAFGQYWFQIKHVKLIDQEIILQLKCIRKSTAPLFSFTSGVKNKQSPEKSTKTEASTSFGAPSFDSQKAFSAFQRACRNTARSLIPHLTWANLVTVVKVGCALIIALIMGIITIVGHLGEYALKLLREVTLLVNAFTPIVIQLIDFLSKIIGGFYILMARMLIRDERDPNVELHRSRIMYSIPYSDQAGVSSQVPNNWRERNRILRQELFSDSPKKTN